MSEHEGTSHEIGLLREIVHELNEIKEDNRGFQWFILRKLNFLPETLKVDWFIKGEIQMSTNAVNLNLDSTAKAVGVVTELNNDGSVFKFDPTKIQVAVQDINVVTAVVDTTTGDITVTPKGVGSTQVVVQDSATNITSPNYTFTVVQVGPTPSSLSVSWTVTP